MEYLNSISLKFNVKKSTGATITIYPKGLLFYSVKPTYAEVVKFFLDLESEKNNERYNSITEIADAFPDKKVSLPVVYKKVDIKSLFEDGIRLIYDIKILEEQRDYLTIASNLVIVRLS